MAAKLLAEFIGTFFLVLTIGLAVAGAPDGFGRRGSGAGREVCG
jgi:glycerol uptake facilitator-like aquaporin